MRILLSEDSREKEFINNACFRNTSNHWREILSLEDRQITGEPLNLSVFKCDDEVFFFLFALHLMYVLLLSFQVLFPSRLFFDKIITR